MPVLADPTVEVVYLITASPRDTAGALISPSLYLSAGGFRTEPTDTPANTLYRNVVTSPFDFSADLFEGAAIGGVATASRGSVAVANNGDFDAWLDYDWDGAEITIEAVARGGAHADAEPVFSGTSTGIIADGDFLRILIASPLDKLDREISTSRFLGTGGIEGGVDLEGKTKPLGFGLVREAELIWVDIANRIGIVHDGAINSVLTVKEGGVALTVAADYASYAALVAATIPVGQCATALAVGAIRLHDEPLNMVTVTFRGDKTGGTYVSSAAQIAERVMTSYLDLTSADYDVAAFTALHTANSAECGIWLREGGLALDAIAPCMETVGAWLWDDLSGKITAARLEAPDLTGEDDVDAAAVFTGKTDGIGTRIDQNSLAFDQPVTPPWRIEIEYQKVNGKPEVVLDEDALPLFQNEYRLEAAESAAVLTRHPTSKPVRYQTLFDSAVDAAAEATRRLALLGAERRIGTFSTGRNALALQLGSDQLWLSHDRYGLSTGRAFRAIGMDPDDRLDTVAVRVWG